MLHLEEKGKGKICGLVAFAAGGTGLGNKIDGIVRKDQCVEIGRQHVKTSARKLKH